MKSRYFATEHMLVDVSQVVAIHCNPDDYGEVICRVSLADLPNTLYVSQEEAQKLQQATLEYERDTMGSWTKIDNTQIPKTHMLEHSFWAQLQQCDEDTK